MDYPLYGIRDWLQTLLLTQASLEIPMQPVKFKSLISPPWPSTEEHPEEKESTDAQRESLSNFERNEKSEENLDHIAILGYN